MDDLVKRDLIFAASLDGAMREKIPRVLRVDERPVTGGIPSIIGWNIGPFLICQKLKDIIEELEPGRHDFLSIDLKGIDRNIDEIDYGTYYLIVCPVFLESILIEKTRFTKGMGEVGREASAGAISSRDNSPCVLDGNVIAGHHFWRQSPSIARTKNNPGRRGVVYFCSDVLQERITSEGMDGWGFIKYCSTSVAE